MLSGGRDVKTPSASRRTPRLPSCLGEGPGVLPSPEASPSVPKSEAGASRVPREGSLRLCPDGILGKAGWGWLEWRESCKEKQTQENTCCTDPTVRSRAMAVSQRLLRGRPRWLLLQTVCQGGRRNGSPLISKSTRRTGSFYHWTTEKPKWGCSQHRATVNPPQHGTARLSLDSDFRQVWGHGLDVRSGYRQQAQVCGR